jgi:hypothetical protein
LQPVLRDAASPNARGLRCCAAPQPSLAGVQIEPDVRGGASGIQSTGSGIFS